ncbi:MAG: radical SAM protein [Microgenomates group bacterium]
MIPKINEITAKTIFTKSGLPASDWVINPYNGCLFGCSYCYAAQIARWKHPGEEWGTYLDVKMNAPELLKIELTKLEKKLHTKDFGAVFFSSVTDPYVGMEAKYKLTRQCLEVLADFGYEGVINIQTKSDLVTRDIDVLKRLKQVSVGCTVTTLDDAVSRYFEGIAPSVTKRIAGLRTLHEAGISTYAFIGPILPTVLADEQQITTVLNALEAARVETAWFEHIHLVGVVKQRLYEYIQETKPALLPYFETADTKEYRANVNAIILRAMQGRPMKFAMGEVIFHRELKK